MNNSRIQYEQVITLANQLKTVSQSMETILNEVTALLNNVGTDVWSGDAAMVAQEQFKTLVAKFPKFYTTTGQCCNHLLSVVQNYKNVDSSIAKM